MAMTLRRSDGVMRRARLIEGDGAGISAHACARAQGAGFSTGMTLYWRTSAWLRQ
jgi:hypothetical protein